eukprot:5405974-Ditylum_brightwellii.AAC.1
MLRFLVNSTHPELAHAVHQCAMFCNDPKYIHQTTAKHVVRYLLSARARAGKDEVIYALNMKPDKSKGLEEPTLVISRTGFIVKYANCPAVWTSKLQTEIALTITVAECIALSHTMRDDSKADFECTMFEDNNGCK